MFSKYLKNTRSIFAEGCKHFPFYKIWKMHFETLVKTNLTHATCILASLSPHPPPHTQIMETHALDFIGQL